MFAEVQFILFNYSIAGKELSKKHTLVPNHSLDLLHAIALKTAAGPTTSRCLGGRACSQQRLPCMDCISGSKNRVSKTRFEPRLKTTHESERGSAFPELFEQRSASLSARDSPNHPRAIAHIWKVDGTH